MSDQFVGEQSGNLLMEISNEIVRLHKEYFGRGPTKARAHLHEDVLVVILQGGLSQGEKVLEQHGRVDAVVSTRLALQESIEDAWTAAVEKLLGRRVFSFMSSVDPGKDIQAEVFVLAPEGAPEPDAESPAEEIGERARAAREQSAGLREDLRALRAEQAQAREALKHSREHESD